MIISFEVPCGRCWWDDPLLHRWEEVRRIPSQAWTPPGGSVVSGIRPSYLLVAQSYCFIHLWPTAGSKTVWSWEWILRPWFCQKWGIVPLKSFRGHVSSNCLQERLEELMDFLLRVAGLSFEAVRRRRVPVPLHQENSAEVVGGIWSVQLTEMCQCF